MKRLAFHLVFLICLGNIFSQNTLPELLTHRLNYYNTVLPFEKVYVQCDRPMYKPGDDVWMAVWITDGINNKASDISEIVYMELITPKGNVEESHRLLASNGRGTCDFKLDSASVGGTYKIRAYTNWMQNFGEKNYFEKEIQVQKVVLPKLLMKLNFERKAYGSGDTVKADLMFGTLTNQPLSNQNFTYTVNINGTSYLQQSSVTNAEGKSVVKFALPQALTSTDGILNVAISFKGNTESISRSIPIVLNQIDLQFLPEGGDLVSGTMNNCAFKALNEFGKPADVEGTVFNNKHQIVGHFKSFHQGMGAFRFMLNKGERYYALIDKPEGVLQLYPLPQPNDNGFIMEVPGPSEFTNPTTKSSATLRVYSPENTTVNILGQVNGKIYYKATSEVKKGENNIQIPLQSFPTGIAQFTLFSKGNVETSERLVFVKKHQLLKLEVTSDKPSYLPRQEITLKIKASTPDGKPAATSIGVSVADNKLLMQADDKSDNILTYLLLSSELNGKIEEPNFYFDPKETKADSAIDYLLLTQGWRRFTWKEIAETPSKELLSKRSYNPEKRILCGTILAKSNDMQRTKLYIKETGQTAKPDKNGYYEFRNLDLTYPVTLVAISAQHDTVKETITDYSSSAHLKEYNYPQYFDQEQRYRGYNSMGKVVDETGEPMPGCSVIIKGTTIGTVTDVNGNFWLRTGDNDILQISFIGYKNIETNASHERGKVFTMEPTPIVLDEIVVVGYGVTRKSEITGSVARISRPIGISIKTDQDNSSQKANKHNNPITIKKEEAKPDAPKPMVGNSINLTGKNEEVDYQLVEEDMATPILFVEQMPEFPGGSDNVRRYLSENIRYPEEASEMGISGRVLVSFTLDREGQVIDPKIIRSVDRSCDQEALRIVRSMPRWRPGRQNGKAASATVILPVIFVLKDGGTYSSKDINAMADDGYSNGKRPNYYKTREFYVPQYSPSEDITERTDFRKTIYWNPILTTDSTGNGEAKFFSSDELTVFRATAEGIGQQGEIGRAEYTFFTSKPASLDVKMPENLLFEDTLFIPVSIHNTTEKAIAGHIALTFPKSLMLLNTLPDQIMVEANSTSVMYAHFAVGCANMDGTLGLKFDGGSYKDAISSPFHISSQGFPVRLSFNGNNMNNQFTFNIPHIIPNSIKAEVVAYPNLISSLTSTVKAMLQEPHGCFEQASSCTYPNIMALHYLKQTKESNDDLEKKARAFIENGYHMLTKFETPTGGFEWFGKLPAHEGLTAYGLMEFNDMKQVYPEVDKTLVDRTRSWLLSRKDHKGGFMITPGKYGFSSVAYLLNNAYLVYALSEIGCKDIQNEFESAYKDNIDKDDAYRMSLLANAAFNRNDTVKAMSLIKKLEKMADKMHLENMRSETSITGSTGKALQVETISLLSLALLKHPKCDTALLEKCITYIRNARAFSSFGSTQANILALKALSRYAIIHRVTEPNGRMIVSANNKQVGSDEYTSNQPGPVTVGNLEDFLHSGENKVDVNFNKSSVAPPFNLNIEYYQTKPIVTQNCPLTIQTIYKQNSANIGGTVRLAITITNRRNGKQPMATAIINIPSGLSLQSWQMKELQEKKLFDYYEISNNQLYLYFSTLEPIANININLDLKAEVPGKYQAPASCCYLYYSPDAKSWCSGANIEVKK